MNPPPSTGRIVHYVLANGQHRAAIVTNAWNTPSDHPDHCNLTVYLDGCNDLQPTPRVNALMLGPVDPGCCKPELVPGNATAPFPGFLVVGSASQDEQTHAPGTWHYPERV